jgi:hypothetical protein
MSRATAGEVAPGHYETSKAMPPPQFGRVRRIPIARAMAGAGNRRRRSAVPPSAGFYGKIALHSGFCD